MNTPALFVRSVPISVVVVQPLPGIGDMIWHLPHIRSLAAAAGAPVTLVAKPRSLADQLLADEAAVRDIIWLDRNPDGRRGLHDGVAGFWRFVTALRARRFDAAVLLHHSTTLAAAALLAGIPTRCGYGYGAQRWFVNRGPVMSRSMLREHQFQRATQWLRAAGVAMIDEEPKLTIADAARRTVAARLAAVPRPFVAIGIGASEASRQWGAANFVALVRGLRAAGWNNLVLLGGPAEAGMAAEIAVEAPGLHAAIGWRLDEAAALLAEAAFYVGNNTGVMNMAAAVGIPTYALFGTTPPFAHSRHIIPIASPHDASAGDDGMKRIEPAVVLAAISARVV